VPWAPVALALTGICSETGPEGVEQVTVMELGAPDVVDWMVTLPVPSEPSCPEYVSVSEMPKVPPPEQVPDIESVNDPCPVPDPLTCPCEFTYMSPEPDPVDDEVAPPDEVPMLKL
jgi:hypothetical protein